VIRKAVSGLGRTLVTSGVILLLFVVYQLWGTGINADRDQAALVKELGSGGLDTIPPALLAGNVDVADTPDVTDPTTVPETTVPETTVTVTIPASITVPATKLKAIPTTKPAAPAPVASAAPAPTTKKKFAKPLISKKNQKAVPLKTGESIGRLVIPQIHVDKAIVQGTSVEALKKGPGHYKTTPFPGERGNAAMACHRTTYGGPCFRLDELKTGDPIFASRKDGEGKTTFYRYEVYEKLYVKPSSNDVLLPQGELDTLTLTTCHPQYSAKQRLVIHAKLVGPSSESELFDVQDPLAAEYQAQIDARNGVGPKVSVPATPPITNPALTTSPSVEPGVEPTVAPVTSVDVDPSTIAENPVVDPAENPTSVATAPDVPAETLLLPADAAPPAGSKPPTFDGERSTGKLYKFLFFTGTAPAWLHSLAWALVCGAIWLFAWILANKRKALFTRWGIYGVVFVVLFLPALYFCFENVSRLLPEAV
jgi:LPXTG-site transpeptidase (sortase) family protein